MTHSDATEYINPLSHVPLHLILSLTLQGGDCYYPILRRLKQTSERAGDLPEVTQLVNSRSGTGNLVCVTLATLPPLLRGSKEAIQHPGLSQPSPLGPVHTRGLSFLINGAATLPENTGNTERTVFVPD